MKNIFIILLLLAACVRIEPEAIDEPDKIYIVFEEGFSVSERIIMFTQKAKCKARGVDMGKGKSHVYICFDSITKAALTTYPADTLTVRRTIVADNAYKPGRVIFEIDVIDLDEYIGRGDSALMNKNGYDYSGAIST